jgi:hypothetical protein
MRLSRFAALTTRRGFSHGRTWAGATRRILKIVAPLSRPSTRTCPGMRSARRRSPRSGRQARTRRLLGRPSGTSQIHSLPGTEASVLREQALLRGQLVCIAVHLPTRGSLSNNAVLPKSTVSHLRLTCGGCKRGIGVVRERLPTFRQSGDPRGCCFSVDSTFGDLWPLPPPLTAHRSRLLGKGAERLQRGHA